VALLDYPPHLGRGYHPSHVDDRVEQESSAARTVASRKSLRRWPFPPSRRLRSVTRRRHLPDIQTRPRAYADGTASGSSWTPRRYGQQTKLLALHRPPGTARGLSTSSRTRRPKPNRCRLQSYRTPRLVGPEALLFLRAPQRRSEHDVARKPCGNVDRRSIEHLGQRESSRGGWPPFRSAPAVS
jgi:hypothetical protein